MSLFKDQQYLLESQYKDASNLNARIDLHRLYSTNQYGWHRWIFDHFRVPEGGTIVELGCGPGLLWASNHQRIPEDWRITLTDFSAGMLEEARHRLGQERFTYEVADAQKLPFADASFDVVIANHMLYHVPEIALALQEIQRVLKPGGAFYASTVGRMHMREVHALTSKRWPDARERSLGQSLAFVLENGAEILTPYFSQLALTYYLNELRVPDAGPLVAFILSGRAGVGISPEDREALSELIEAEIVAQGGLLKITTASGLFAARRA